MAMAPQPATGTAGTPRPQAPAGPPPPPRLGPPPPGAGQPALGAAQRANGKALPNKLYLPEPIAMRAQVCKGN